MRKTVWVVEYRYRRKGLNKNRVRRRWSRWRYYSVLTIHKVALRRARHIREDGDQCVPGVYAPWGNEFESRVVPFDRRRR